MSRRRVAKRVMPWLLSVAMLSQAACGGSDDPPTGSTGDFTFAVTPTALTLAQGQSGQVTATLTRTGGFAGAVAGTVEGVPAGVVITPLSIAAGSSTAQVTVTVGSAVPAGAYPITIRANATGVAQKTLTVTLTVTAAANPTVAIALNPTALTMLANSQGSSQATITRGGGFAGAVTLNVTGAPAGMTVTAPAIAAGATTATITTAVSAAVANGVYPLTVRATGTGVTEATATLTVTVIPEPIPTVAIAINPTALTVVAGAQGTTQATITRGGGFSGAVTLNVTGAPAGVTITAPAIATDATTATITTAVGAAVAPGAYPLTVRATGIGVTEATTALTLTVTSLGSFTLSASPAAVSITQGQTAQTTVTITRVAPHVAPVTLAITGLPNGVSASVNPSPTAGTTATITFTATAGATVGASNASIIGTGGGVSSAALNVPITVQSGGGGAGNVTFNFCQLSGIPLFFAYQDGLGAWTRAMPNGNNTYSFTINSPRGGVAYVMGDGGSTDMDVNFGSVAELNALGSLECDGTPASGRTITGSVTGLGEDDVVFIAGGGATSFAAQSFPNFSLDDVRPGVFDLIAAQFIEGVAGKFIIRRNLNPPNATALPVLDFAGAEAFTPLTRSVTINNGLGQDLSLFGLYVLQGGFDGLPYFFDAEASTSTVRSWFGVPTDKQAPGDLHVIFASASTGENASETRQFGRVFRDAANQTFTLPAALTAPGVSVLPAAGGNSRLRTTYSPQNDFLSQWTISYRQAGNPSAGVTITMTAAYSGGGAITLDVPDLTPLAGWNTNWGLKSGISTNWNFLAYGWSESFGAISNGLVEGAEARSAQKSGTITP